MSSQLGDTTAKCRPFYDIFDANRTFLCRNIVDYINALWFFAFLTLLLWSIGTPVGLNLINIQRSLGALHRAHTERSDSQRARPRERASSATRERSTSSNAGRQKPQLRRTATEETIDLPDEALPPQERETSHARHDTSTPTTPARSRGRLERSRDDNWGSSAASRGPSHERDSSQARAINRQPRASSKPPMRRQGTEEFDLSNDTEWTQQQTQHRQPQTATTYLQGNRDERGRRRTPDTGRNKPKIRRTERESYERDSRRSMTPILPVRPDTHPALPMPRTPTRLRNRVSLTTRAVANIVRANHSRNKPQRGSTEDMDLEEETEVYGARSAAVAAAQRTPPRTAPPPPPPPNYLNRYGSERSIHFNTNGDELDFEEVEAPNPIYANTSYRH